MEFVDLATEYCDLNVFNAESRNIIMWSAKLFDRRSGCSVEDLSPAAIAQFKKETLRKAKAVTYNGYLRYLRLLGDFGVEHGYLHKNWFRYAKTAPLEQPLPKVMSDNTMWQLVEYVAEKSNRCRPNWFWIAVIKTLYSTGIRRRQIVGIRVKDVDFESRHLFLRANTSKTGREWCIPLHDSAIEAIQEVIEKSEKILQRALRPDEPIFNVCRFNRRYQPDDNNPDFMRARSVTDFFKGVKSRTGLKVGAHRFRHTVATKLCNPTGKEVEPDIFGVQSLLGHTSVQTTRNYVQTSVTRLERLVDTLEIPALMGRTLSR
ncbi:MAG TPA: site-specific integrase [Cellvibrio sp.]|nr:site-specific integrase [Cellvibrio sp.]